MTNSTKSGKTHLLQFSITRLLIRHTIIFEKIISYSLLQGLQTLFIIREIYDPENPVLKSHGLGLSNAQRNGIL